MFKDSTNLQLLQAIDQAVKNKQIVFWIDGQDCYLWENTLHYSNKIKVGDLSLTKENYFKKLTEEFLKLAKESQARGKFLTAKFSEISDVELIEELGRRVKYQTNPIKLSMYPNHQHILVEGKDIKCNSGTTLPIEIKKEDESY